MSERKITHEMKKFEAISRTMQKDPSSRRERSHGGKE
jgi:hypothetical protein